MKTQAKTQKSFIGSVANAARWFPSYQNEVIIVQVWNPTIENYGTMYAFKSYRSYRDFIFSFPPHKIIKVNLLNAL